MNELQIFSKEEFGDVRVVEVNGEPWFMGRDVCAAFGDTNANRSMGRIDDDDRVVIPITDAIGRKQDAVFVNEGGLYALLFAMQPQKAHRDGVQDEYPIETQQRIEKLRAFKRWVTHDVIPQIRKSGGYHIPQTYAEALRELADKTEEAERLALENAEMKPKAEFFDAVADSKDAISIGEVAKVLDFKGIGRNKLFEILRDKGVLMHNNIPYQKYIDNGYFRTVEQKYAMPDGETRISIKTLVYQKGVDGIRKILMDWAG